MKHTIIDLLRHGEPEGGSRYRGNFIDDPLSKKGWSQMWAAVGDNPPWDIIISSPLQRCAAFADALAEKMSKPVVIKDQFKEVGFGCWEGKTRGQLKQDKLQEYNAFYSDPVNNRPSGAESLNEFIARVTGAYDEVVNSYVNQHILIVAHAGVIRATLAHVLQASAAGLYRIQVDNASISRIKCYDDSAVVDFINEKSI